MPRKYVPFKYAGIDPGQVGSIPCEEWRKACSAFYDGNKRYIESVRMDDRWTAVGGRTGRIIARGSMKSFPDLKKRIRMSKKAGEFAMVYGGHVRVDWDSTSW